MRVSSLAFRLFLTGCLVATDARFQRSAFVSTNRATRSQQPQGQAILGRLHEQKGNWWENIFNIDFSSTPESRRSLGIEDNTDEEHEEKLSEPKLEPVKDEAEKLEAQNLFFSEDTGKPIPGWVPPEPKPPESAPPKSGLVAEPLPVEEEQAEKELLIEEVEALLEDLVRQDSIETATEREAIEDAPPEIQPEPPIVMAKLQERLVETEREAIKEVPSIEIEPPILLAKLQERLNEPLLTPEQAEEVTQAAKAVVDVVVSPLIAGEIEKGVPQSTIQYAAVASALFALVMSHDITTAALTLVVVGILSITPGPVGDVFRTIGELVGDVLYRSWNLSNKLGVTDIVSETLARIEYGAKVEKLRRVEAQVAEALQLAESCFVNLSDNDVAVLQQEADNILKEADKAIAAALQIQETKLKLDDVEQEELQLNDKAEEAEGKLVKAAEEANRLVEEASRLMAKCKDLTVEYDAAARLAFERSPKNLDYEDFRLKFEADAVADVKAKVLKKKREVEERLAYEKQLEAEIKAEEARLAKIAEEERLAEKLRVEEEARLAKFAEEKREAEEQRVAEEARLAKIAEEERMAKEARIAEEKRVAEEARLAKVAEELRLAEEQRAVEEARLAEAARLAEEARQAEEARLAKEASLAEQALLEKEAKLERERLAERERLSDEVIQSAVDLDIDDDVFGDEDWEASVEMAKGNVDGIIVDSEDIDSSSKADWEKARKFAQALGGGGSVGDPPMLVEDEESDDIGADVDMEELARAAREAVEMYEQRMAGSNDASDGFDEDSDEFLPVFDEEPNMDDVGAAARAAVDIGAAARAAVAQFEDGDIDFDMFLDEYEDDAVETSPESPEFDWASLKISDLRAELKSRGLPTTGKKGTLVSLLEANDLRAKQEQRSREVNSDDDDVDLDFGGMDLEVEAMKEITGEAVDLFDGEEPSDAVLKMLEKEEIDFNIPSDDDGVGPKLDYSFMTVNELKDELRSRGLKVTGKKSELIERLQASSD